MKKVSVILSHLSNKPQFKNIKKQSCYQKFISLVHKKSWKKMIAFVYVREQTLYIVTKHPALTQELNNNYNKDLLKTLLMSLRQNDKACKWMEAKNVVIFTSKYRSVEKEVKEDIDTVPRYHELATGDFNIESNNKKLAEKFQKIKKLILCNQ